MPIARQKASLLPNSSMVFSIMRKVKHGFTLNAKPNFVVRKKKFAQHKAMLKKQSAEQYYLAVAGRLREALKPRGMKARVARRCNISIQAITGWVTTGRIEKSNLLIVSEETGRPFRWLMTGEGPALLSDPIGDDVVREEPADYLDSDVMAMARMIQSLDAIGRQSVQAIIQNQKQIEDIRKKLEKSDHQAQNGD